MNAVFNGLGAAGFNRRQPVDQHRIEDVDHLPIAVNAVGRPVEAHAYSDRIVIRQGGLGAPA
ncbi:hypothetical protein [Rhodopseudomonas palustris]|uniref:hypothetical protein n=1 Tax=Rhodopseudomonas palustris TaxID=1076 RepID=UPI0005A1E5E4